MKIMITGYSGSGKSTLCRKLSERYHTPFLHLDTIQFLPGWEVRADAEKQDMIRSFLDEHPGDWIAFSAVCTAAISIRGRIAPI